MDITGTYTHSATPSNVSLSNTVSASSSSDGWHLVGNPYPSTIDWDAASGWTKTNLSNAIYFWDPDNDRYASYVAGVGINNGSRYIPSMQAFWVKVSVSGGTGTLGMTNAVRTTTASTPALWRVSANTSILKVKVNSSQTASDETVIRLSENAHNSFDQGMDAYKMINSGNTPSLFTQMGSDQYSINSVYASANDIEIPLHLKTSIAGEYAIEMNDLDQFDNSYSVLLKDLKLNEEINVGETPVYSFMASPSDTTGRFVIILRKKESSVAGSTGLVPQIRLKTLTNTLDIEFLNDMSEKADIVLCTTQGQIKYVKEDADIVSGVTSIRLPFNDTGIFIVKVVTSSQSYSGKVYLK